MARLTSRRHLTDSVPSYFVLQRLHRMKNTCSCTLLLFLAARRAWSAWRSTSDTTDRPTRSRHDARRKRREESITRGFFLWQQLISSSDPLLSSMNNSVRCHGNGHLSPWKWGYSNLYIKSLCSSNAANVGTWFSPFDAKTLGRVRCCCFDRQESEFWVLHHPSTSCWCLQHTHIKVDTPTLLLLHGAQTALQSWRLFWWSVFTVRILINSKSTTCIPNRATHIEHTVS